MIMRSLQALGSTLVGIGRTRLELFGLELAEQKTLGLRMAGMAAAGLVCLVMAASVLTMLLIVLFWETPYRLWAIAIVGLAWALAGSLLFWRVLAATKQARHPFELTLAELERDRAALEAALSEPTTPAPVPARNHGEVQAGRAGVWNPSDSGSSR